MSSVSFERNGLKSVKLFIENVTFIFQKPIFLLTLPSKNKIRNITNLHWVYFLFFIVSKCCFYTIEKKKVNSNLKCLLVSSCEDFGQNDEKWFPVKESDRQFTEAHLQALTNGESYTKIFTNIHRARLGFHYTLQASKKNS